MIKNILRELRKTIIAIIVLSLLLCGIYPLVVWGVAQLFFPAKSNGSLIRKGGAVLGSELIGQRFTGPGYFHTRPSAAGGGYDASASGGSNLGPLSSILIDQVKNRVKEYRDENHLSPGARVPVDAVTASGSGLDPHISVENAMLQAKRVSKARGMDLQSVIELIEKNAENRQFGIFGEKRVNVLSMNLELDSGRE
jgi:potassium-transporting ATPase KdpC subunit